MKARHEVGSHYRIGIVLNLTPAYPRSQHPEDVKAARIAELFQAKSFLDPSVLGHYPEELVEILWRAWISYRIMIPLNCA